MNIEFRFAVGDLVAPREALERLKRFPAGKARLQDVCAGLYICEQISSTCCAGTQLSYKTEVNGRFGVQSENSLVPMTEYLDVLFEVPPPAPEGRHDS